MLASAGDQIRRWWTIAPTGEDYLTAHEKRALVRIFLAAVIVRPPARRGEPLDGRVRFVQADDTSDR